MANLVDDLLMTSPSCRAEFEALDRSDPLREFRARFALPVDAIYLDGNSLGALPRDTPARVAEVIRQEWGDQLIASWNAAGWIDAPLRVGQKIGRLIGANDGETVVADSTSVNLYKLLSMALALRPDRRLIIAEADNFPTDLYIAQGLIAQLGNRHELRLLPSGTSAEDYVAALDHDVALLMLSHVNYRTGAMHPLRQLTDAAHDAGALTLWDLAHSAGAVPLALADDGADFAVGCGYKYLNGGPGAPAFLYIAERWQASVSSPLTGWFGHVQPFDFSPNFAPAPGIAKGLCGTPPILSLTALEVGVDLMLEAPMSALREKSIALCEHFIALAEARLASHGFTLASPRDAAQRGSQICLRHADAWPICQALIADGVTGDFRAPDILRFGFTPMYTRHTDLFDAVSRLVQIMESGRWRESRFARRSKVT